MWQSSFQDFTGGDVDYRIVPSPNDEGIMAPPGNNYAKNKTCSPLKSNASTYKQNKYIYHKLNKFNPSRHQARHLNRIA